MPARLPMLASDAPDRAAQRAAVRAIIEATVQDTSAAVCVTVRQNGEAAQPDPAFLDELLAHSGRVVPPHTCPPTYASWLMTVTPDGTAQPPYRPEGAVDPYVILVTESRPADGGGFVIELRQGRGMTGENWRCEPAAPDAPMPSGCRRTSMWIS